jgi:GNAT superfamily N-acetyltransferase
MLKFLRFVRARLRFAHGREIPVLLWLGLRSIFWTRYESRYYSMTAEKARGLPNPRLCRRDCLDDLQHYERFSYYQLPKGEYLPWAEEQLKSGGHLYTLVESGVLAHVGWLGERREIHVNRRILCAVRFPPESALLWDFATHPSARGRGFYRQTLCQCLHDAVELYGARQVCIFVAWDNPSSRHVIEKIGFEYQGSIVRERKVFNTRRRILPAVPSFDAWPVQAAEGRPGSAEPAASRR